MARTQILKGNGPNIFLGKRKVFGILFLLVIHSFSAKVNISKYSNLVKTQLAEVVLDSVASDRTDPEDPKPGIYVTSGVTVVDLDNEVVGNIMILEPSITKGRNEKKSKKKKSPKIAIPNSSDRSVKKESKEAVVYIYPSSKNDHFYSTNESNFKALVPSQISSPKYCITAFLALGKQKLIEYLHHKKFDATDHAVISEYQILFFGRAPPVLA